VDTDRHDSASQSGKEVTTGYQLPAIAWAMEAAEAEVSEADVSAQAGPGADVPGALSTVGEPATDPSADARGQAPALPQSPGTGAAAEPEQQVEHEPLVESVADALPMGEPGSRLSRPAIAAAATAGVVLIGLPLLLLGVSHPHHPSGPRLPPPAGFSQPVGGNGFVPSVNSPVANGGAALLGGGALGSSTGSTSTAVPSHHVTPSVPKSSVPTSSVPTSPVAVSHQGSAPVAASHHGSAPVSTPRHAAPPAPATFVAVAGPSCSGRGTGFSQYGWYDQGDLGWKAYSTGGWVGNSCGATYDAVPMSGDAHEDDGNSTVWTFDTGAVLKGSCQISVYIPDDSDVRAVGGDATYYTVQNQFEPGSDTIGSFSIDQVDHRGQWVDAGTFAVAHGGIAVMLHTRGEDWVGSTVTDAHHAADAVRADCTA